MILFKCYNVDIYSIFKGVGMMVTKNRVVVKILGQEYSLVSDDTREHMQRISNIVDDKMRELYDNNKKMSTSMVAVLTALNMTDEYLKALDGQDDISKKIDELESENRKLIETLKNYENTLLDMRIEIDENSKKYNEEIDQYKEAIRKKDLELEEFINTFEKEK